MNDQVLEYRRHLILSEQKAQEDYDKAIISLSGGALGISFAFISEIVPDPIETFHLLLSWICWGGSITSVIISYFTSQKALKRAIHQVDSDTINQELPGGLYTRLTSTLNYFSGILFIIGIAFLIYFVNVNIGG